MSSLVPDATLLDPAVWAACSELVPSPTTSWAESGGLTASSTYIVPWAYRFAILDELISFRVPFPHLPVINFIITSASVAPFGSSPISGADVFGNLVYDQAQLTLNWSQVDLFPDPLDPTDPEKFTIFTEAITPTAEYLILDASDFKWSSGSALKPAEAPGKIIRGFDYVQTRYFMPEIPNEVGSQLNTCNAGIVSSQLLGIDFPIETLMYSDPSISRTIQTSAIPTWTLACKFSYRPTGWNKFWRAATQDWEEMKVVADDTVYKNVPAVTWPAGTILL